MQDAPVLSCLPSPACGSVPDSETGRLFVSLDWSATPLGPMEGWPQSLRIAASICLNSRFPMFVWWGPQLVNIYNDAYIPVLGQRHPAAFGRPARRIWSDIWNVLGPQVEEVIERGQATWNERVLLVMQRNGYPEDTWFTWSYSPILEADGSVGGLFCACTEETARMRAEGERDRLMAEAQDAARTLQTWFDQAPGFVALMRGPEFVFELVNNAYYQLIGHRRVEGLPAFEALPDLRNQGYEERMRRTLETGQPFVGRALRLDVQEQPGGPVRERYIDLVFQPVRDSAGAVIGIFAQGHDVTEQVQAVKGLQEADRRKDEFLATLAHELRNPLAPIRQATALARSPQVDAARRAWALEVIERQSAHMALLLEDLLDVSRISRDRLVLRPQPIALTEVVQAAVETVQPLVEARDHQLLLELPREPLRLQADPVRLAQVLSNLLSNAAKYTDPGGRIVLRAAAGGGELVLRVQDNGIGLSPESQARIFEMFSQVDSALDRAEGGLGIGLALSRGLVALHGGRLEVHSAGLGQGSEFILRLPLGEPAAAAPDASAAPAANQARRILLADDNADALDSLAMLLELEGHEVLKASCGREALALAESRAPDLVILDIGMPDISGYEVASQIRAAPWGRTLPLVALTGWGQAEDQARARAAGFDHHLTKPVEWERLEEVVRRRGGQEG